MCTTESISDVSRKSRKDSKGKKSIPARYRCNVFILVALLVAL